MSPRPAALKTSHIAAIAIMAALVLYLVAANVFSDKETAEDSPVAASSDKDLSKLVRIEEREAVPHRSHLRLNGATQANRQVRLKAQVEGQVAEIHRKEGAKLRKGDLILRLDERDRKAQVAQSKALLEQRTAEYNAAQKLNKEGFYADVRLAQSKAEFESAKAQLAAAEDAYAKTFIRAPFDGVLEELFVEVGDLTGRGFVMGGDDSAALVVEYDPIVVVGQVPQQRRAELEPSLPAKITLFGNREYEGRIRYIGSVTNADTRTFRVEVEVPNPDGDIPVGVSAGMLLPAGEDAAYNVSPSALSQDDEGKVGIKLVDDEGIVRFHHVTMLEDSREGFWVGGLPERIRFIAVGQNYVSPGQELSFGLDSGLRRNDDDSTTRHTGESRDPEPQDE